MATQAITLTIQDSGVIDALSRAQTALTRLAAVHGAVGAVLEKRQHIRFDLKESPSGQSWKAWSPSTAAARAKEGRGTLLEYTGQLRDSLSYTANNSEAVIGFTVPYAEAVDKIRPLLFEGADISQPDADAVIAAALTSLRQQIPSSYY